VVTPIMLVKISRAGDLLRMYHSVGALPMLAHYTECSRCCIHDLTFIKLCCKDVGACIRYLHGLRDG
jgi:hypothetical protein